tara:strand:- start:8704 stop:10230 length:1527 start_codon:yes stop_codon:yes gene_type:complete
MFKEQNLHKKLDELMEKYSNNEYIYGKLENYIENQLPKFLDTVNEKHNIQTVRKQNLAYEIESFVKKFVAINNYYYCNQNKLFLFYNNINFVGFSEDEIQHNALSLLREDDKLRDSKHKVNKIIIREIKLKSPLNAIPESKTIQDVIQMMYSSLFPSKNYVKYFLCVIGDCILNKNETLIYIISNEIKHIVHELTLQMYNHFGKSNTFNNIKFKYHDHNYKNTRLIYTNKKELLQEISGSFYKFVVDVLCVSCYYSNRYGNSDKFLINNSDKILMNYSLYLHNKNEEDVVNEFLEKCIQQCSDTTISYKNMIFVWKIYLDDLNLPNIMFQEHLCDLLKKKICYNSETDTFENVTSVLLPNVATFIKFWDTNMVEDNKYYEIEISEVCTIYKEWSGKNINNNDEIFLIKLIKHFYQDILIVDNKFILNIRCIIWDKKQVVYESLEMFRHTIDETDIVTIYDAYEFYISFSKEGKMNVSKKYFETISKHLLGTNLDDDGLIQTGCPINFV